MDLIEVIECRGPAPKLVVALLRGLPESSLTTAMARGGEEHLGWDRMTYLLADLYDAINQNTRASGNFKKPPKIPPYPRPKQPPRSRSLSKDARGRSRVTVRDLHKQFSR